MSFDKYGFDRRASLRAMNMGGTLQKTDRILTGNSHITVRVVPSTKATFSVRDAVQLGVEGLDLGDTKDVLAVMGQNYHEVSHVLFTPRLDHRQLTWNRVDADGNPEGVFLKAAFNFLEEARVETLFGAQYPKAKHFFTVMVSKLLLGKYETPEGVMTIEQASSLGYTPEQSHAIFTHLLVYGRRYLPSDIRDSVREYVEDVLDGDQAELQKVEDAEAIVDEYRLLPTSKISTRGRDLVILLTSLYPNFFEAVESNDRGGMAQHNPIGTGASEKAYQVSGRGAAATPEEQEEVAEKAAQDEADGYEEIELDDSDEGEDEDEDDEGSAGESDEESEDEDDDSDGDGDGDEGDEEEDDETSGSSSTDSDEEDENGDLIGSGSPSEGDDGDEGSSGDAAGTSTDATPQDPRTLREILEEIAQTVAKDSRIRRDVQDVMGSLDSGQERSDDQYISSRRPPTSEEHETGRRLGREFMRLAQEVSPGWNYGSDSGRLNVNRAMYPDADPDQVFDEWDEGREQDAAVEMVFLVDMSGSMDDGRRIYGASSFAWTICEALKEVEAKVTVYGFSNVGEVYTLRGRDDTHSEEVREFKTIGGTNPAFALNAARALLASSDLPNRVLVVATDGQWAANRYENQSYIWDVNAIAASYAPILENIPAHKTLIGIGEVGMGSGDYFDALAKYFDVAAQCSQVTDLTEPILKTVEGMVRAHLHA